MLTADFRPSTILRMFTLEGDIFNLEIAFLRKLYGCEKFYLIIVMNLDLPFCGEIAARYRE
jgi:hypothetical protein